MDQLRLDGGFPLTERALQQWDPAAWTVAPDWQGFVGQFLQSDAGQRLGAFIRGRLIDGATIFPANPFRALAQTPLSTVRVVILGQDPYHGPGQAQGLAFSVAEGIPVPPSLRNIFKEISREAAVEPGLELAERRAVNGSLESWAGQGVLLLNTCLTVEQGQPASHAKWGWEFLTDAIIQAVWAHQQPTVFMLWGAHAQTKQVLMTPEFEQRHLVLTANHPSPLSAMRPPKPFIGCGHFSLANAFLRQQGGRAINW